MGHNQHLKRHSAQTLSRARGFTLLEIVIVIAVIGLLTAGLSMMLTALLKSTKSRVAADNALAVQQAVQRFVERSGRLPCPAPIGSTTGIEDAATNSALTTCTSTSVTTGAAGFSRGLVPWGTLGIGIEQVQDGYARMFSYNVTRAAAVTTLTTNTIAAVRGNMTIHGGVPIALGLPPTGNQINTCWTAAAPAADENSCNMRAVIVLVSHGENGLGASTSQGGTLPVATEAAEVENTNGTVAFVKSDPTATGFDDVVFGWSPDELLEPLIKRNTVKSAVVLTNETMRNVALAISNAIVNAASNCGAPPCGPPANYPDAPLPAPPAAVAPNCQVVQGITLSRDAWGNCLVYATPVTATNICGSTTGTFTLASAGIDGVATAGATNPGTGLNDDFVLTVTVDQIRSQLATRFGAC